MRGQSGGGGGVHIRMESDPLITASVFKIQISCFMADALL